jgi:hypothetical protein
MKNFDETVFVFTLFILFVLGTWKAFEIIIWCFQHIRVVP